MDGTGKWWGNLAAEGRNVVKFVASSFLFGMLFLAADARAAGPELTVIDAKAEGPVNYESVPGGDVSVYFTVQNTGSIAGNVRAYIYFCRENDPNTCYGSPDKGYSELHKENVGELLSPGKNKKSSAVMYVIVKIPSDAQPGTRWVRIHVTTTSGETDLTNNDAFASYKVVAPEPKCIKYNKKKGKKKKCVKWG